MACHYTGSAEGDARLAADEAREEASKVTRLLCEANQLLDALGAERSEELKKWWREHKIKDAARAEEKQREVEKDRLRRAGLEKLTATEKKALGL